MSARHSPSRKLLATAIAAIAVLGGVSACSSAPSSGGGSTSGATTTGGTLTTQFAGVPISLNPALGGSGGSAIFTSLPYDSLIWQTGDGTLIPDLATDWKLSDDNKKLTLTLRKGVTFTDGATMDAAAVKASLEYFLKAGGGGTRYAGPVDTIEAPSDDTVVINYKSAYPDGPAYLTQYWSVGQIIGPEGIADPESLLTESDGTGQYAYSASDSVTGSSYTYVKNKDYFNPDAQQFDKVVVKVIGDPSAVSSAITTGQVDFAGVNPTTAATVEASGLKLVKAPFFTWGLTVADTQGTLNPALKSAEVRQAMALAIDREALASAIGADFTHANGQMGAEGTDGYVDGFGFEYDVKKAKSLLAEGGYPDGFSLDVLTENILDGQTTISQAIAGDLGKIGIKVNLVVKNSVPDFIQASLSKQYPAVIWPVVGANSAQVVSNFIQPGVTNPFGNTNEKLSALYEKAQSETSASARTSAYEDITKAANEEAWFAPVLSTDNVYAVGKNITGVTASALNPNPLPQAPDAKYAWKRTK
ncbi:ABC transporter substrate-binding protein [Naasia aerilata]|uniref:Peptide ABC transporter substrate-binding protein n=1 Tax=Naasia aerilata TaxID=1162966 RepID=A0ABN6XM31_9MICO|nr:ABC transporter substrate-binding protein [Naasia aerilata]BDZ46045.1 peptide ABC transporter substrate-binding protein [Naasia aerilata]